MMVVCLISTLASSEDTLLLTFSKVQGAGMEVCHDKDEVWGLKLEVRAFGHGCGLTVISTASFSALPWSEGTRLFLGLSE